MILAACLLFLALVVAHTLVAQGKAGKGREVIQLAPAEVVSLRHARDWVDMANANLAEIEDKIRVQYGEDDRIPPECSAEYPSAPFQYQTVHITIEGDYLVKITETHSFECSK
jgi:hypothetical protein